MTKEEIIQSLQTWVVEPTFQPDRERIQSYQESFRALEHADEETQKKAFIEGGGEESDFTFQPGEDINRFKELLSIYHDKRKQLEKEAKQAEANNAAEKQTLIDELQGLIQDEENIGKAYKRFNAIKQKWNEIGPAPKEKRRDLQAEYSRLIELFYYNINIYRELQINDLKKNQELKMELIEKIKHLEEEKSINQVDFLIHQYLDEWDQIGPTFKEEWEKIRTTFKEEVSKVFDRIRDHRKAIKDEHHQNLEAKQALVEKVQALAEQEVDDPVALQKRTKEVIALQKEWKKIGFAGRGKNDSIWKSFRSACDAYFSKRDAFMAKSDASFNEIRERKQALIDRAAEIHQGDDVQAIANELKGMQRKWKEIGKLLPHEEYKLFKQFRKYCVAFFDRKKKAADAEKKAQAVNQKSKETLIQKVNDALEKGLKDKEDELINAWRSEWAAIGWVHPKAEQRLQKQFDDLMAKPIRPWALILKQ